MSSMFEGAVRFNKSLSNWCINKDVSIKQMFRNATNFNKDLSSWELICTNTCDVNAIFTKSTRCQQPQNQ